MKYSIKNYLKNKYIADNSIKYISYDDNQYNFYHFRIDI